MKPTNCEHNFTLNSMAKIYFRKSGGSPLLRFSDFSGQKKSLQPLISTDKKLPPAPVLSNPKSSGYPKNFDHSVITLDFSRYFAGPILGGAFIPNRAYKFESSHKETFYTGFEKILDPLILVHPK